MSSLPMRTPEEEVINAYTHLAWALLSFVICGVLVFNNEVSGKLKASTVIMTGFSSWTFLSSFLYHITEGKKKKQNRELDKSSIFLMIMGCGVSINMSCIDEVAAIIGCTLLVLISSVLVYIYIHSKKENEVFSMTSYILLGWICILPMTGLMGESLYSLSSNRWSIMVGVVMYSLGILFYARDSIKWFHTIWHFFVMGGYAFHLYAHYKIVQFSLVS